MESAQPLHVLPDKNCLGFLTVLVSRNGDASFMKGFSEFWANEARLIKSENERAILFIDNN
jgi:hypothetical protein